ncbi:MAG: nitrite reductase (NADH) large subunit [Candidatus Azotimanducaceae bacterium]|jgi:nitrite reductase (NADH) large subunit
MQKADVVVVGNGMVGHHFVESLNNISPALSITVLGEESAPAYDRVHLSDVFAGTDPSDLALTDELAYRCIGVTAHFGDRVTHIDTEAKQVTAASGLRVEYDKLVLATGSYPFVPPIPGFDLPKCLVYRTLDDLVAIRSAAKNARRGVVVGGGLLGLECANALRNLGLETHVVEFAPGLMGVQLDETGSATLRSKIEDLGLTVHTNTATQSIEQHEDGSLIMNFAGGAALQTDLIVFSAGIRPSDQLAKETGLAIGERGGVVIDDSCATSHADVFAIGECALYDGRIFGLVAPGYRMAEVAASQVSGGTETFQGADMSTKLKLLGVEVGSVGDAHGKAEGSQCFTFSDPIKKAYMRMNVDNNSSKVTGAVLVGDCSRYDTLLQYYLNELPLPEDPTSLLVSGAGGVEISASMLPDTATICSCHNVSKGVITGCIEAGCMDLGELKAETKASTGCGGCAALLKSTFESELEARGLEVDRSLCEHFGHTRQALFHICQVEGISQFADLISQHGRGKGCDICKPVAASIFASLYNEHVLEKPHVGLQDTNDHVLANMQKNGTYSVVPRIPGGIITPDKLIAIGAVGKKYDLYTKITGGQRIDLFGAQIHELPAIWHELIQAGFETGHAYGKSLRTVKSCVGSTWCRYGVQDSVAMALLLEDRYKGLRSPHKLKMAVSGCTRECAEAQSKDVGVIATENGWNLFVGGNGGMRPRHADLFATDLDDNTLLLYIDRFLMFYVRTADRLQRTSVWLESLDGGLDYAREVVIDDSLGICAELEAQMNNVVGTYQCEWKSTLGDKEKLKRFRQFVNTDESDPDVVFVRERGQRRPATEDELALAAKAI